MGTGPAIGQACASGEFGLLAGPVDPLPLVTELPGAREDVEDGKSPASCALASSGVYY